MLHARRAFTLAEMLVATTLAGAVLAIVTTIGVRQQRVLADLADDIALGAQLQEARVIPAADYRAIAPPDGDVRDARDTSLEFRATLATAIVCDTAPHAVILAPASDNHTLANFAQPIEAGDTAWLLVPTDSGEDWRPSAITSVATAPRAKCAATGPALDSAQQTLARTMIGITPSPAVSSPGLIVRVTRPVRYSLYHASDGAWYLGQHDWNYDTQRLNTIQPVAGPLLAAAQHGLRFTYLDSAGAALATPVADPRAIALIRLDLRGQTRHARRALAVAGPAAPRADSATSVIFLRNRR